MMNIGKAQIADDDVCAITDFEKSMIANLMKLEMPRPPLPIFLLRPLLSHLVVSLVKRHPGLFDRLGPYGGKRFLIKPSDLPFTLLLVPEAKRPRLEPYMKSDTPSHDASIVGPIGRLIDLVNGEEDGDALFFSRDIVIEGDTEAVIALRNAIDDLEINLIDEIEELLGPLAGSFRFVRERAGEAEHLLFDLKMVMSETILHRTINRSRSK